MSTTSTAKPAKPTRPTKPAKSHRIPTATTEQITTEYELLAGYMGTQTSTLLDTCPDLAPMLLPVMQAHSRAIRDETEAREELTTICADYGIDSNVIGQPARWDRYDPDGIELARRAKRRIDLAERGTTAAERTVQMTVRRACDTPETQAAFAAVFDTLARQVEDAEVLIASLARRGDWLAEVLKEGEESRALLRGPQHLLGQREVSPSQVLTSRANLLASAVTATEDTEAGTEANGNALTEETP